MTLFFLLLLFCVGGGRASVGWKRRHGPVPAPVPVVVVDGGVAVVAVAWLLLLPEVAAALVLT